MALKLYLALIVRRLKRVAYKRMQIYPNCRWYLCVHFFSVLIVCFVFTINLVEGYDCNIACAFFQNTYLQHAGIFFFKSGCRVYVKNKR